MCFHHTNHTGQLATKRIAQARAQQELLHQNQILLWRKRIRFTTWVALHQIELIQSLHWCIRLFLSKMIFHHTNHTGQLATKRTAQARAQQELLHQILLSLCKTKENRIHNMSGSPSDRANIESSLMHQTLLIKNDLSSYEPHGATGNKEDRTS